MPSAFIDDGQQKTATIPATDEYDAFEITFRPMLRPERERLVLGTSAAHASGEDGKLRFWEEQTVQSVAKHIVSWTLLDGKGNPVKPTAANLGRIEKAFTEIYNRIAGYIKDQDAAEKN